MGEVFVADYVATGGFRRTVALKLLLANLADDPKHVALFLSEARIAALLRHPNIVQVYDFGVREERYFIAMELVDGVSLSALITSARRREERFDVEVLSHVARQSLEALHYVHTLADERGRQLELVHRDISPANLLVSIRGEVKLSDFGIAKMRDSEHYTAPGEVRGKLAYLAPEVLLGASATVRSDLYALGITLYRLATHMSPFMGDSDLINAVSAEKVPLQLRRPDLPADFCEAVDRALSREPADRFASAAAMREGFSRGDLEARSQQLAVLVQRAIGEAASKRQAPTLPLQAPRTATVLQVASHDVLPEVSAVVVEGPPKAARSRRGLWAAVALGGALVLVLVLVLVRGAAASRPVEAPADTPPTLAPSPAPPQQVAAREVTPALVDAGPAVANPEPAAVPPAQSGPPVPVAKVRPARVAPRSARLSAPALLFFQATPWAHVEVNGRAVGQTPLGRHEVTTSEVVVRFSRAGYRTVERRLRLTAGEVVKLNERLEPDTSR